MRRQLPYSALYCIDISWHHFFCWFCGSLYNTPTTTAVPTLRGQYFLSALLQQQQQQHAAHSQSIYSIQWKYSGGGGGGGGSCLVQSAYIRRQRHCRRLYTLQLSFSLIHTYIHTYTRYLSLSFSFLLPYSAVGKWRRSVMAQNWPSRPFWPNTHGNGRWLHCPPFLVSLSLSPSLSVSIYLHTYSSFTFLFHCLCCIIHPHSPTPSLSLISETAALPPPHLARHF